MEIIFRFFKGNELTILFLHSKIKAGKNKAFSDIFKKCTKIDLKSDL